MSRLEKDESQQFCEKDKKEYFRSRSEVETKLIFVTIATKINEIKIMKIDVFKFKDNLFDDASTIVNCTLNLENKHKIKTMINNDNIEYFFIDINIAHKICKLLNINSLKLNKSRKVKKYDENKNKNIIYVIYSFMTIQDYTKNFTSMMIIKLNQHSTILRKS